MKPTFNEDAGFLMSWLGSKTKGIEGAVICVFAGEFGRPGHQLGPRLLVAQGNKLSTKSLNDAVSMLLTDPPEVLGELPRKVKRQALAFVVRNREALLGHWNGETDTREMCDLLKRV